MFRSALFFALMGMSLIVQAGQPTYGDVRVSRVTTIYYGDTFTATIDSWPGLAWHCREEQVTKFVPESCDIAMPMN